MPTVVLPVGLPLGPTYPPAGSGDPVMQRYEVSLGTGCHALDQDELHVFAAARATPELHAARTVTRQWLVLTLGPPAGPLADPDQVIGRLLDRGLLTELPLDGSAAELEASFRRHRLHPLGEGLGATPEQPRQFRIGHGGEPVVIADNITYTVWAYARTATDLWSECAEFAADVGTPAPEVCGRPLTAEHVARDVAGSLPVLISAGCGFLDLVGANR